jgi:hypothetical protein
MWKKWQQNFIYNWSEGFTISLDLPCHHIALHPLQE